MGVITQPWSTLAAGDPVDAAAMRNYLDTIRNEFNGNIDNANIKAGANIDGAKMADLSISTAKLANSAVTSGKIAASGVQDSNLAWTGAGAITALRAPIAGKKVKYGSLAIPEATFGVTASYSTGAVNLNTMDDDETNSFSTTPRLIPVLRHTEAKAMEVHITALTASAVTFNIRTCDGVAHDAVGTINIDWIAIGNP